MSDNPQRKLSIGQMAKLNNISVQTLRYYEKLGLLVPKWVDENTNYRYYDLEQSSTLDIIKYLKKSDLTLQEIHDILSAKEVDIKQVNQLLEKKARQIELGIHELNFKKVAIQTIIDSLEAYRLLPEMGTIVLEHFPKRYAFIYCGKENYYQNPPLYEQGLMKLKAAMAKYDLPHFYSLNPASVTRKQYLQPNSLYCDELFIYVDKLYTNNNVPLTEISGGTYLCIYCNDILCEEKYTYQLLDHIQENNYEIIGDCISESINDIMSIRDSRKNLIIRIKIPVRFQHFS
ncbi:MerR family transcriptional regulator [Clostridiales bacterium COT073_COT-073]|nr:MerR family transcriptional regulator [Clostridiales bacterium COT073_COT-073]